MQAQTPWYDNNNLATEYVMYHYWNTLWILYVHKGEQKADTRSACGSIGKGQWIYNEKNIIQWFRCTTAKILGPASTPGGQARLPPAELGSATPNVHRGPEDTKISKMVEP